MGSFNLRRSLSSDRVKFSCALNPWHTLGIKCRHCSLCDRSTKRFVGATRGGIYNGAVNRDQSSLSLFPSPVCHRQSRFDADRFLCAISRHGGFSGACEAYCFCSKSLIWMAVYYLRLLYRRSMLSSVFFRMICSWFAAVRMDIT